MKKQLKAIITGVFLVLLFTTITGCSTSSNDKVNSKQITQDLKQHPQVVNCFNSRFVTTNKFTFEKYEIIKRKSDFDERTDTINCYIYAYNEYFSVKLEANLEYAYYDVGGWVLDEFHISNKNITPLCAPDFSIAQEDIMSTYLKFINSNGYYYDNYWKDVDGWFLGFIDVNGTGHDFSRHLNDFKFKNFELSSDGSTAKLNASFTSSLTKISGYFLFEFNNTTGWQWVPQKSENNGLPVFLVNDYTSDYSDALGTFKGFDAGRMSNKILKVREISENQIKAEITYYVGYYNENTKSAVFDFDIYSGHFHDGSFTGGEYYYNPSTGNWEEINLGTQRIQAYERIS